MKKLICFFVIFLSANYSFAAAFKAIKSKPQVAQQNFIIAKINNKAITNSELDDRYRFVIAASKINIDNASDQKLLSAQILDKMIEEELIRQEAKNLKIEVSASEVEETLEILAAQQKKNLPQFKNFFSQNNLSFENYLAQIESEILWSKIISEVLRPRVKVSEIEINEFFEQQKFNTSVQKFFIAEIFIANNSQNAAALANKLVLELKNGADFNSILQQFSSGTFVENNGEIGWVSAADIDKKIYAAISKLNKNSYSEALLLADGYHIFKLLNAKTETKIAEQDLNAARNAIFSKKLQTIAKGHLMDMRKKSFVEIAS